jgi:lipoate-protein ligase A
MSAVDVNVGATDHARQRRHHPHTVLPPAIRSLDLLTAAVPEDPVLDIAVTHALLRDVAAGRRAPALRVFLPGPTVAFGRLDALRPGFAAACDAARRHGHTPVIRPAGGHAAVYDARSVVVEHVTAESDVTAGLQERFTAQSEQLRGVLTALGLDARIGELRGEYCAGAHSINLGGRLKVVGIAQRAIRGAALTTAVITVQDAARLRALIADVYAALAIDIDPATAGTLDERLPDLTAARVADLVAAAYGGEPTPLDDALLAAARDLVPRHVAP